MRLLLRSLWIWLASASCIIPWSFLVLLIRLFDRDPRRIVTARWFRRLGRLLGRINPWRIYVAGIEHYQAGQVYVVVSNHQSLMDIPLLAHLDIDAKWLAKSALFKVPFVGWMMSASGDILVERDDKRKAAKAFLRATRYLRQGVSLVFFAEGTRTIDGDLLPFNDGPFQLALREKIPVLPIILDGTGQALPRQSWLYGARRDLHVRILPPLSTADLDPKAIAALREAVRDRMAAELTKLRDSPTKLS